MVCSRYRCTNQMINFHELNFYCGNRIIIKSGYRTIYFARCSFYCFRIHLYIVGHCWIWISCFWIEEYSTHEKIHFSFLNNNYNQNAFRAYFRFISCCFCSLKVSIMSKYCLSHWFYLHVKSQQSHHAYS